MFHKIRKYNIKNIENYFEIYIKSDLKKIIKLKKKKLYYKKKNIVGLDLKPEFPKKTIIIVNYNFLKSTETISLELSKKY